MIENFEKSQLQVDNYFMKVALNQAQQAYESGEVPIGSVLTFNNKIILKSYNQVELLQDVTAHSELLAISGAGQFLQSKYLNQCTLYVTLEPCSMCAGAIGWSQLKRLVFGASDEARGYRTVSPTVLHPKIEITSGILEKECREILLKFFREKRKK